MMLRRLASVGEPLQLLLPTGGFRGPAHAVFGRPGLLSVGSSRASSQLSADVSELESTKKKVTGRFGVEWFIGRKETEVNAGMVELPRPPFNPKPYKLAFRKYPGIASGLGAEYYYRDGQRHPLTYYHMRSPALGGELVAVGATDERAREVRTIDNYVKERTRGFAVQIVLEGRGVKAYFEPKSPNLKVRLGVGAKVTDLTEYCTRDPDCEVTLNKKGDVVVVHGPNKARVGTLAYRLLKRLQPKLMPYTGKGGHFPFHPERRKAVRKK
mmetsp:Transcript_7435/g.20128  ORF Transcript_7435/g.20128 Transcript_7435/m.20128 type:complete len:269 (-) Transcript_7435:111-917(-)